MNLIGEYIAYFRAMAESYLPIGSTAEQPQFATMSREEVVTGVRSSLNLGKWTMILLKFEPKIIKTESRHFALHIVAAFEIVKDNAGNIENKTNLQNEALGYCIELAAKMMNEHVERTFPIGNLDDGTIEMYEINEVFDTCVGYGCQFVYTLGFDRKASIVPSNWII
jgi:hypothetical protein